MKFNRQTAAAGQDADTLAELEETAFLTVEANGMSGTNPGHYLYWAKYPDGTEQEINVRL